MFCPRRARGEPCTWEFCPACGTKRVRSTHDTVHEHQVLRQLVERIGEWLAESKPPSGTDRTAYARAWAKRGERMARLVDDVLAEVPEYTEDETGALSVPPENYEEKYADFIRMCQTMGGKKPAPGELPQLVIIAHPWVMGDNYEELVESLNRLADANLVLAIAQRQDGNFTPDPPAANEPAALV